tara:strand:- start:600 stop:947 length:348 start_codon:yes stop_codon:yes gene_type:complete
MRYFKIKEFKCPCCGNAEMNEEFLDMLDDARGFAGIPFKVNSGWRCEARNKAVGGKSDSAHLSGFAADISCKDSRSRALIINALGWIGFNRMGIAKNFIHVDSSPLKDKKVIWLY